MLDGLTLLGATNQPPGAAGHHLVIATQNLTAAHRAAGRQGNIPGIRRSPLRDGPHHLGNHIPGPVHHHGVADADIQAPNFINIVQGGIAHGNAAHLHRLQPRHGCQGPGAPHLPVHAIEHGELFLGRKFVGNCPARRLADEAQVPLPIKAINLVDHPVDVVVQRITLVENIPVEVQQGLDPAANPHFRIHSQAPIAQGIKHGGMGFRLGNPLQLGHGVGVKLQGTFCGNP